MKEEKSRAIGWLTVEMDWRRSLSSIVLFAFLVRIMVSLHPYSGASHPPMYGDYEAQRHWMEITIHTPAINWYQNTSTNPLSYWGLDYPPLTAYQSWAHGLFLHYFHPPSVALVSSRGHESSLGKLLMRWTVLLSDALVFFPAAICFIFVYCVHRGKKDASLWLLTMVLLNPALIVIDHGHFQYNCISLGFTLGAVEAILAKHDLFAAVLFSLALNHKQMSAYFAPAFFAHLLGKCLKRRHPLLEVLKLGIMVVMTFAVIWWPYLSSVEAVMEVLSRLAPFERGIYEDYVANFWCSTSIFIKWKRLFTTQSLKLLSFGATLLGVLPSMGQQIRAPSDRGFLYALLNSSFSFYLFSYQVHEKSILLPLLPASLLALEEPVIFKWLIYYALFSMFPLLCRDQLIVPYIALLALFLLLFHTPQGRPYAKGGLMKWKWLIVFPVLLSIALHIIYLSLKPPEKYPFLFEAFMMILCFSQFVTIFGYTNVKQWMLLGSSAGTEKIKKIL
ncbi:probable dolichyl pyrophosphate Man9GlcNAc2 alpha-1,3-glucosyltransferase [Aristolochia californica]|uniref:probable dolichyl pyrophosphate Man9GlcNAc2 alpha-1,3-glucosyltransferase n=1 Tax=Aristolochia californica TaxID=171875 RepID=UPI0035D629D9